MNKRTHLQLALAALAVPWTLLGTTAHAQDVLKIGVNGVMSGEAATKTPPSQLIVPAGALNVCNTFDCVLIADPSPKSHL